jgi:hypothetical protein
MKAALQYTLDLFNEKDCKWIDGKTEGEDFKWRWMAPKPDAECQARIVTCM